MAFENCEQVNTLFIQGQQHINRNLIKKKFVPSNAYFGRVPSGTFPTHSGFTQRGHRLHRQAPPKCQEWRKLEQDVCNTNLCDFDPETVPLNGSETYYWFPVQLDYKTDWLCLDSLIFNEFPEEEIAHIENHLQNVNREVNEEFARTWYTHHSANKWVGLLPCDTSLEGASGDACNQVLCGCNTESLNYAWQFETYDNGTPNSCRLRVQLPHDQLYRISAMSLDLLDEAIIQLQLDGDYIMDSIQMFDLVVPDLKVSRQLQRQDDTINGGYKSTGGYRAGDLDRSLGVQKVINNYALRYDNRALKYVPAQIADQPLPAAFDAADPDTWALLIRVNPYIPSKKEIGIGFDPNPEWQYAPFAVSNIFQPRVGAIEDVPGTNGMGSARKVDPKGDSGVFSWKNPDWTCNVKRNKGFWMASHRLAFHPREVELGHSFLHRLDHRLRLVEIGCDITTKLCEDEISPYCCSGVQLDTECSEGVQENRVQLARNPS